MRAEKLSSADAVVTWMVEIGFVNLRVCSNVVAIFLSRGHCRIRKGVFLLNVLNHKAPSVHFSAKHYQTHPQSVYKVIRKDKLKPDCVKFLAI